MNTIRWTRRLFIISVIADEERHLDDKKSLDNRTIYLYRPSLGNRSPQEIDKEDNTYSQSFYYKKKKISVL